MCTRNLVLAVALGGALASAACGPAASPATEPTSPEPTLPSVEASLDLLGPVARSDFAKRYARAFCAVTTPCCRQSGFGGRSAPACESDVATQADAALAGLTQVDGAAAKSCIDWVTTTLRKCYLTEEEWSALDAMALLDGRWVDASSACALGRTWPAPAPEPAPGEVSDEDPAATDPAGEDGEATDPGTGDGGAIAGEDDASYDPGAPKAAGEACLPVDFYGLCWNESCAEGLYCSPGTSTCEPLPGEGGACELACGGAACDGDLFCDPASTRCTARHGEGAACTDDDECLGGCVRGVCKGASWGSLIVYEAGVCAAP